MKQLWLLLSRAGRWISRNSWWAVPSGEFLYGRLKDLFRRPKPATLINDQTPETMEERTGFLTPALEKLLADALDEFLKFRNALVEKADGPVALLVIRGVDNRFADRIAPA